MSETSKNIREEVSVDLFARNLLMILFLIVSIGYLMITQGKFGNLDLSFALIAIIVAGVLVYLGSMAKLVFRGSLVRPITESVYYLAPAAVMAILFAFGPSSFPSFLGSLAIPGLLLGAVLSVENVLHARRGPMRLVLRALVLLIIAVLVQSLASGLGQPSLGEAVLVGGALAASLSLLSLFREHSDGRLRSVGALLARTWAFLLMTTVVMAVSVYAIYLRPLVKAGDSAVILMFEWLAVGLAVLVLALLVRRTMKEPIHEPQLSLESMLHGTVKIKGDQARVVEAVADFITAGSKEKVLVMIIEALKDNGLGDIEVSQVVGKLIRYHEDDVPLAWAWTYGDLAVRRHRARSRLIKETLDDAAARVGSRTSTTAPGNGAMEG